MLLLIIHSKILHTNVYKAIPMMMIDEQHIVHVFGKLLVLTY